MEATLHSQQYRKLSKDKRYCAPISGEGDRSQPAQMTRLVGCWMKQRCIPRQTAVKRRRFARRYTVEDIRLLASVDAAHEDLSGLGVPAEYGVSQQEFTVFGKLEFREPSRHFGVARLRISGSKTYVSVRVQMTHTQARQVSIGERRSPMRGSARLPAVDTVPQGSPRWPAGVCHVTPSIR